jgi:hypothetical protein
MKRVYFDTEMKTLNICHGFTIVYKIFSKDVIEKDNDSNDLGRLISEKIKEGLSIVNLDSNKIIAKGIQQKIRMKKEDKNEN